MVVEVLDKDGNWINIKFQEAVKVIATLQGDLAEATILISKLETKVARLEARVHD